MALSDPKKRDFIKQLLILMENKSDELITGGYTPETRLRELKDQSKDVEDTEANQHAAMAAAKDATSLARQALVIAYKNASNTVELITGILGKENSLVKEIRKMRK